MKVPWFDLCDYLTLHEKRLKQWHPFFALWPRRCVDGYHVGRIQRRLLGWTNDDYSYRVWEYRA